MTKISHSHSERRKDIVGAAQAIAAAEGWPAVTVRAIAARIGCSAPAIYQYFQDKDAILAELAAEGSVALATAMEVAVEPFGGRAKRLRAASQALWDFALTNPELYAVMFGAEGLAGRGGSACDVFVPEALKRLAGEILDKRRSDETAEDLAARIAATAHGFISLTLAGTMVGGAERAATLFQRSLDALIKGIERH